MEFFAFRIGKAEDEHVLGHPAFLGSDVGSNTQSQALFAEQRVAAVAGTVGPDQLFFREVGDVLIFQRGAGPTNILLAGFKGSTDRVQARHERIFLFDQAQNLGGNAGHDVHIAHNVGRVGDFDAVLGDRRANGTHGEGNDIHGPALHATRIELLHDSLELNGINPVVGRTGILFLERGNIGAALDASDVGRIGIEGERVRALLLIQFDRCAAFDHFGHQAIIFFRGTITPNHLVRSAHGFDFRHPVEQLFIGCGSTHYAKPPFDFLTHF